MRSWIAFVVAIFVCAAGIPLTANGQTSSKWVAPRSGLWNLKGSDDRGTNWSAKVTLVRTKRRGELQKYRGDFNWLSADGSSAGRESFTGRFDRRSGLLRLKSSSVVAEKGDLGPAMYVGFGRSKGKRITRGKWHGSDVVPGVWSATWVRPL
jgi:hypothetical protein